MSLADSPPALSILTAVRNGRPFLEAAIESIRAQTFRDWEWILVDDGSTDGTPDDLKAWAEREPRMRLMTGPPGGIVAALNRGLAHCCGALIARMDADDVAHPERLRAQIDYLAAHPDVALCDTQVELMGGARNAGMQAYVEWVNAHSTPESIAADLFVESPIVHPAVMVRAPVITAAGGYREGNFPEDYDLWLRLHAMGHRFGKVPRPLFAWRDRDDRLSRTDRRYHRRAFTRLKQAHLAALDGAAITGSGFALWGATPFARPWRQWLKAIGARPRFVAEIDPERIGQQVLGAEVVSLAEARSRTWSYLLVTVSGREARQAIREELDRWHMRPSANRQVRFV